MHSSSAGLIDLHKCHKLNADDASVMVWCLSFAATEYATWPLSAHNQMRSCRVPETDGPVQVRLKVKDWFSIRALPNQIVKVNKRWQLGNSPVALRVNYECPLDNLANPLRAPARLMVR